MEAEESCPPRIIIRDEAHIVDVVDALGNETHTLSMLVEDAATSFPVTLGAIDPVEGVLSLSLLDAQGMSASELGNTSLILRAESACEALHFDNFKTLAVTRDGDLLKLQCTLPRALYTTSKRRSVRVPFIEGMQATVTISMLAGQPPVTARLRNLSVGGCLLELPLSASAPFRVDERIPEVSITFPNGEAFAATGLIHHINPAGRSHDAAVGIAFCDMSPELEQRLNHFVNEAEREAAYHSGEGGQMGWPSPLFRAAQPDYPYSERRRRRQGVTDSPPMVSTIREVARQLHVTLLALQHRRPIPGEALHNCADTLLQLLDSHRQNLLYALCCLHSEPQWIQHSISVAARLGDLMRAEPEHASRTRAAMVGVLLHDMGKAMLLSNELPSLDNKLTSSQKVLLSGHVEVLLDRLRDVEWLAGDIRHDVIACINERLDGSGYPTGMTADKLSSVARMAAVIDVVDAMTRPRGDRTPLTAIEAYRYLYNRPERFDKWWVTRYIQRHGFYPIGSLVRFSRGFLAWVMELDDSGQPERVRVVMNTARHMTMNDILSRVDFPQLGKLEGLLRPEPYQLAPF